MPFARGAIEASAIRRITTGQALPNYQEEYQEWRQAFLKRKAGIYTIPIKDAVSVAEETWRNAQGCGAPSR